MLAAGRLAHAVPGTPALLGARCVERCSCHGLGGTGTFKTAKCTFAAVTSAFVLAGRSQGARRCRQLSVSQASTRANGAAALWQLLKQRRRQISEEAPYFSAEMSGLLKQAFDDITSKDLGVDPEDAASIQSRSGVGYQEIYEGPEMTLAIFLLRAGARIPLHDHPGMTVCGRLLFGRMRARSFDIEEQASSSGKQAWDMWGARNAKQLAVLKNDIVMGPLPVTYCLGPEQGNLHELEAIEDCAFFDLLAPPYNGRQGRDCNYYTCKPVRGGSSSSFQLQRTIPWDFDMETREYCGTPFL